MKDSPLHFYMRIFYQSLKRAVSILAILCLIITSVPAVSFADADTGETSDFVLVDEDGNQYPAVKDPSVSMVGYNNKYPTEATKGFYIVDVPRGVDFKKIETNLTTDNWSEALQGSSKAGKNLVASELLTADRLTGDYAECYRSATT